MERVALLESDIIWANRAEDICWMVNGSTVKVGDVYMVNVTLDGVNIISVMCHAEAKKIKDKKWIMQLTVDNNDVKIIKNSKDVGC